MYVIFVLYLFLCAVETFGIILNSKCPNFSPVDNFNLYDFGSGVWHEVARYENEFENSNCGSYELEITDGWKIFKQPLNVLNIPEDSPDYIESTFEMDPEAGKKGILLHKMSYGNPQTTVLMRENILAIDYDKYYISGECNYDRGTNTTYGYAWIYTRSKHYGSKVRAAIDKYLKSSQVIDASKLIWLNLNDKSCNHR